MTEATAAYQQLILRTVRRARLGYLLHGACVGWLIGAGGASLLLALSWAMQWDVLPWYPVAVVVVGLSAGIISGATRRVRQEQVALWLDRQARLQERLSTAQWLSARGASEGIERLQLQDAEAHAQEIDLQRFARIAVPRSLWGAVALSVLALFLWFAPDMAWLQSPQARQQKQAMRSAGERAEQLAKQWREQAAGQDREKMRQLAARLEALSKQMQRARLSKREAMVQMSRLQREAEAQQRRLAEANSGKPLQRARDEFLSARTVQQQLQQAKLERELSARLQNASAFSGGQNASATVRPAAVKQPQTATPFANEMATQMALALSQGDAQKLGELLERIAQQWNQLSPQERQRLQELLRELAKALKDTHLDAASKELQEALKNLEVGDLQKAVEWMRKASGT
ncbi:MAG: hypothetical protein NZ741_05600 [Armatimonadetes bacterium]|nr:hypothetical protein [Armatimonadota bacterium]